MIARTLCAMGCGTVLLGALAGLAARGAPPEAPGRGTGSPPNAAARDERRLREGSALQEETGVFQDTGNRIVFQARGRKTQLTVLENLALERISATLEEDRQARLWTVSGVVTEFRGGNYLLVSRAVLRARHAE